MPRLTNRDYLIIRHFLVRLWAQDGGRSFAVLPGYAQHELHDFYAPTVDMTDQASLAHRIAMTKAFPSLPHSAGRAFKALRASLEQRPNLIVERHRAERTGTIKVAGKPRTIRISTVSRPKVDAYYLTKALLQLVKEDIDGKLLKMALKARRRAERDSHHS